MPSFESFPTQQNSSPLFKEKDILISIQKYGMSPKMLDKKLGKPTEIHSTAPVGFYDDSNDF